MNKYNIKSNMKYIRKREFYSKMPNTHFVDLLNTAISSKN